MCNANKNRQVLWIVFTDLDGTLLDENDYSFSKALKAVAFLKERRYPIIPCTSKTHQEVIALRSEIGLQDPFIVENGSAVFVPENLFTISNKASCLIPHYHHKILGKKYDDILEFFKLLKSSICPFVKGFSEMSMEEIMEITGLDLINTALAKNRSFSEPFVITAKTPELNKLQVFARKHGFRILRGNRFFHLLGNSDKGKAVEYLLFLYREKYPKKEIRSIGLGDSPNDFEMLRIVDLPVLVNKPSGRRQDKMFLPNLIETRLPGPEGWQEAIFNILQKN